MSDTQDYLPQLLQALQGASPEQSMEMLRQAANAHPRDARPLLLLAAEAVQAKQLDQAEAAYTLALVRVPDFWIARFQLGLLQFTSARPAIAFVTWAPLDSLDASHPLRLFKNGIERLAEDDFEQATQLLRQGIAANTENPPLNHDMEMLIQRIAQVSGAPAAKAADQAPQEQPTDAHFLVSAYRNVH